LLQVSTLCRSLDLLLYCLVVATMALTKATDSCACNSHLVVRLATSGFGGALSKASSRTCRRRFFDYGSYQFCVCYRNQSCRRKKKRIFLCARFPPRGEVGDIGIWGGRSPRPPLELVVADFLIRAATNFVRATGKKEKKNLFVRVIPTSW
jgi:hypothetical protein